jgi:hypothetical protein
MRPRARRKNRRALIVEHSDITLRAEALHAVTHGSDFLSGIGSDGTRPTNTPRKREKLPPGKLAFPYSASTLEKTFNELDVGGLMVNDVSTFRMDYMPYGGVKHSGLGREGLRYAIQEMTEIKLLTLNHSI